MRKMMAYLTLLLMMLAVTSCEHRPLEDLNIGTAKYVRIYIDEHIKNITEGFYASDIDVPEFVRPNVLRVVLCDPVTGNMVSERFLQHEGKDERGYYLDGYIGAPEGDYRLMVYNFGTETTQVLNEGNCFKTEGYTNHISMQYYDKLPRPMEGPKPNYDQLNILYEPDHLWSVSDSIVRIRETNGPDTLWNSQRDYYTASTIVKSYYIQIGVRGAQWISSISSLLTGVAGSKKVYRNEMVTSPSAIVYFEMKQRQNKVITVPKRDEDGKPAEEGALEDTEVAYIYSTFNTWGKLPDVESVFKITFSFTTVGGGNQTETMDITHTFTTEEAMHQQWIIIDKEIEIKKPQGGGGGGFTPGVDEWEDEEHEIII